MFLTRYLDLFTSFYSLCASPPPPPPPPPPLPAFPASAGTCQGLADLSSIRRQHPPRVPGPRVPGPRCEEQSG